MIIIPVVTRPILSRLAVIKSSHCDRYVTFVADANLSINDGIATNVSLKGDLPVDNDKGHV